MSFKMPWIAVDCVVYLTSLGIENTTLPYITMTDALTRYCSELMGTPQIHMPHDVGHPYISKPKLLR